MRLARRPMCAVLAGGLHVPRRPGREARRGLGTDPVPLRRLTLEVAMRQRQARSSYTRWALLLIMAVVAALAPRGTAWGAAGGPALTVMTRNLYLGTGLDNTVTATTA